MTRLGLFLFYFLAGATAWAQTVYLRPAEALQFAFRDSEKVILEKKSLTEAQRKAAEKALHAKISRTDWNFYLGKTGEQVDGYAVIDYEIGRMEPITFMTVISPQGEVRSVEILVYRESQGSEVREPHFLRQFQNKTLGAPIQVGRDINNISGATLSARAVSLGVRRALAVWEVIYGGVP